MVAEQLSGVHYTQKQPSTRINLELTLPSLIERGTIVLKEVVVFCCGALLLCITICIVTITRTIVIVIVAGLWNGKYVPKRCCSLIIAHCVF